MSRRNNNERAITINPPNSENNQINSPSVTVHYIISLLQQLQQIKKSCVQYQEVVKDFKKATDFITSSVINNPTTYIIPTLSSENQIKIRVRTVWLLANLLLLSKENNMARVAIKKLFIHKKSIYGNLLEILAILSVHYQNQLLQEERIVAVNNTTYCFNEMISIADNTPSEAKPNNTEQETKLEHNIINTIKRLATLSSREIEYQQLIIQMKENSANIISTIAENSNTLIQILHLEKNENAKMNATWLLSFLLQFYRLRKKVLTQNDKNLICNYLIDILKIFPTNIAVHDEMRQTLLINTLFCLKQIIHFYPTDVLESVSTYQNGIIYYRLEKNFHAQVEEKKLEDDTSEETSAKIMTNLSALLREVIVQDAKLANSVVKASASWKQESKAIYSLLINLIEKLSDKKNLTIYQKLAMLNLATALNVMVVHQTLSHYPEAPPKKDSVIFSRFIKLLTFDHNEAALKKMIPTFPKLRDKAGTINVENIHTHEQDNSTP